MDTAQRTVFPEDDFVASCYVALQSRVCATCGLWAVCDLLQQCTCLLPGCPQEDCNSRSFCLRVCTRSPFLCTALDLLHICKQLHCCVAAYGLKGQDLGLWSASIKGSNINLAWHRRCKASTDEERWWGPLGKEKRLFFALEWMRDVSEGAGKRSEGCLSCHTDLSCLNIHYQTGDKKGS